MSDALRAILAPQSIAVIGASRRAGGMGHQILHNLIAYDFKCVVCPVNPRGRSICAVRAYPRVADVPDTPDVAVVVVPKEHVFDVAEECGEAGVKGLVVISAGFREDIIELDVNPLLAMESGAVAVDARVRIQILRP